MRDTYSLYEAKAKLSAIVRRVRAGHHVTVTLHGEPVAELRPIARKESGLVARLQELEDRGIIVPSAGRVREMRSIVSRPGALKRFLDERD